MSVPEYPMQLLILPGDTVFKAKAQRADVEDAEVIVESHDTEVERPLDLEEAEEVEEEKGEEIEGESAPDNKVLYCMNGYFWCLLSRWCY